MTDVPDTCSRCGEKLKPDDRFCERCGKAVEGRYDEADHNLEETKSVIDKFRKGLSLQRIGAVIIIVLSMMFIMMYQDANSNYGYWMGKGDAEYTSNPTDALQYYGKALKQKPFNAEAFFYKGCILSNMGRLNESLMNLSDAIKFDSNNYKAWEEKADIYLKQNQNDEAIKCFEGSIKVNLELALKAYGKKLSALETANETLEAGWTRDNMSKIKEMIPLK